MRRVQAALAQLDLLFNSLIAEGASIANGLGDDRKTEQPILLKRSCMPRDTKCIENYIQTYYIGRAEDIDDKLFSMRMDTYLYHEEGDEHADEFFWEPSKNCISKARFKGMFAMSDRECI